MILPFSLKNVQLPDLLDNQRLKHICILSLPPTLCVCTCVCCICECEYTRTCVCECVEINLRCSSGAIHLFFETGSLIWPRSSIFSRASWSASSMDPHISIFPELRVWSQATTPSFSCGFWRSHNGTASQIPFLTHLPLFILPTLKGSGFQRNPVEHLVTVRPIMVAPTLVLVPVVCLAYSMPVT